MLLVLAAAASVTAASAESAQLAAARTAASVQAPMTSFRNCTALNRVYRHGVGKYRSHTQRRSGHELQAQQQPVPTEQWTRPRQGRHRLREAL